MSWPLMAVLRGEEDPKDGERERPPPPLSEERREEVNDEFSLRPSALMAALSIASFRWEVRPPVSAPAGLPSLLLRPPLK